jgi:hypothetical protein
MFCLGPTEQVRLRGAEHESDSEDLKVHKWPKKVKKKGKAIPVTGREGP